LKLRLVLIFLGIYALIVFAEWFRYLRGFDTSVWNSSNWWTLFFVLVLEVAASAMVAFAINKALPVPGGRAPASRSGRRRRSKKRR
jgi:hypothetical protein